MPPIDAHTPPIMALAIGGRLAENSSSAALHARTVHMRMRFQIKVINTIHCARVTGKGLFMTTVWA